jgi:hypothetical protein
MTRFTEGFSHFVTSMTAPVASGWSVRRVGLAPTGKRRLTTAHTPSRRFGQWEVLSGKSRFTPVKLGGTFVLLLGRLPFSRFWVYHSKV